MTANVRSDNGDASCYKNGGVVAFSYTINPPGAPPQGPPPSQPPAPRVGAPAPPKREASANSDKTVPLKPRQTPVDSPWGGWRIFNDETCDIGDVTADAPWFILPNDHSPGVCYQLSKSH